MLEYVFFEESIRDKFVAFLTESAVEHRVAEDGLTVEVSEETDDATGDAIDHCYESLLQENMELMEQGDDALEKNVAGVQVQLSDGAICTVRLDPELVGRILGCISMEELRDMVQEVAHWVELKDNSPLCHVVEMDK
jgi:hypothetical protein